jgi:hypothetical protein
MIKVIYDEDTVEVPGAIGCVVKVMGADLVMAAFDKDGRDIAWFRNGWIYAMVVPDNEEGDEEFSRDN